MKRTYFLLAAGLMCHAMLLAQTQPGASAFQPAQALGGGGGRGGAVATPLPRTETGKPFSATVVTQTTQTLADGTRVNKTTTMLEYRDAEGRVRTETTQPDPSSSEPVKVITIRDPVAGVTYRLDPAKKSAVKFGTPGVPVMVPATTTAPGGRGRGGAGPLSPGMPQGGTIQAGGGVQVGGGVQPTRQQQQDAVAQAAEGGRGRGRGATPASTATPQDAYALEYQLSVLKQAVQTAKTNPNETTEDLGTLTVNGVPASGTRTTTVVPVGAIGNDREFRSVSERWFSTELNLLVKSVNTDPRFGTTTYELTNISRQPPALFLFQVPADYELVSNGVRQ